MTVCEADSTTSIESDSTVCYNSDSDNDSVLSGPMFVKDKDETDDELPHIAVPDLESNSREHGAVGGARGAVGAGANNCTHSDKCECHGHENAEDKKVFYLFFFLFFLCLCVCVFLFSFLIMLAYWMYLYT